MLGNLFASVLRISLTTGVIILAVVLLSSRLNRRYVAGWKYWLWLLLAVRLLVPVNPELPNPPVQVQVPAPVALAADPIRPAVAADFKSALPEVAMRTQRSTAPKPLSFIELGGYIWLLGATLFLLWQLAGYLICKRRLLRWARGAVNARINVALEQLCADMGITKKIALLISSKAPSPMMIGFFKPYLILPQENYNEIDLVYILRHELIHFKRHDLWYKLFMLLVTGMHWFNPMAHLLMREAGKDLEIACDDAVICRLGLKQRQEYGDAILRTIQRRVLRSTALSTSFSGSAKTLKERFSHILGRNKKRNGVLLGVAILTCAAVIGSVFAIKAAGGDKPEFQAKRISFPVSEKQRTEFNAAVYERPIEMKLGFPVGWSLREREAVSEPFAMFHLWSALEIINEAGETIGVVGYNIYEEYEGAENDPRAIYNQIAPGNNYQFDVRDSYTVINETESGATAICGVRYSANINNGKEKTNKGIVAYNKDLLAYVAFEFAADKITDEQLESIAESIALGEGETPVEGQGLARAEASSSESIEFFGKTFLISEADFSLQDEDGNTNHVMYNGVAFACLDYETAPMYGYLTPGQKLNGMTVEDSIRMGFDIINGNWELSESHIFLAGPVELTGELTLTSEDGFYPAGTLLFTPSAAAQRTLPIHYGDNTRQIYHLLQDDAQKTVPTGMFNESDTVYVIAVLDNLRLIKTDRMTGGNMADLISVQVVPDLSPAMSDEELYRILTEERGLEKSQIESLIHQSFPLEDIAKLTDEEIAKAFAPGTAFMGDYMSPEESEKLIASGMAEEDVYVLNNLGYDYASALALTPEQLDFIFPNTELVDNLVALGYNRNTVRSAGRLMLEGGYDTYKDLLDAVFASNFAVQEPETPKPAKLAMEQRRAVASEIDSVIARYQAGESPFGVAPGGIKFPKPLVDEIGSGVSTFNVYTTPELGGYTAQVLCYRGGASHMYLWISEEAPGVFTVRNVFFSDERCFSVTDGLLEGAHNTYKDLLEKFSAGEQ